MSSSNTNKRSQKAWQPQYQPEHGDHHRHTSPSFLKGAGRTANSPSPVSSTPSWGGASSTRWSHTSLRTTTTACSSEGSHANVDRARGDYENWFQVWLDFSSSISQALETDGYTYVFDTDITQFFPSVDRERAKHALAQRTYAHHTLLEPLLLHRDLGTTSPYCAVPGLPIEPNDVSRLIAHNYIKGVDEHFVGDPNVRYLRWVDDTVIFVPDEDLAHDVKRRHSLALREMGLSPNASKTFDPHRKGIRRNPPPVLQPPHRPSKSR